MQKEDDVKKQKENIAIYKPRGKAQNRSFPHSPQEEPTFLNISVSDFYPPDCEAKHFCWLSLPVCSTSYGNPSRLVRPDSPSLITLLSPLLGFWNNCSEDKKKLWKLKLKSQMSISTGWRRKSGTRMRLCERNGNWRYG